MKDVIVIPTYNERDTIRGIIEAVFGAVPEVHVLVVDDSSPDGTADIVREAQGAFPKLRLFLRKEKTGLGNAYMEAFKILLKDPDVRTMTTMDADWSHDPKYLSELLREAQTHDMVIGSRYTRGGRTQGWDWRRRLLSWGGNLYARTISGVPVRDLTAGFVTFGRRVLERMPFGRIHSAGYAYTIESKSFAHKLGARIKEVPICFTERRSGASKMSGSIVVEGLIAPWRMRFARVNAQDRI